MKFWKLIITVLIMAAWLPATVHCELETAGLVPVDECCADDSQRDHRCEGDCSVVEDRGFKTECMLTLVTPPEICILLPDLAVRTLVEPLHEKQPHPEAFKIHHLPQFVIRTALPIRGPSLAS